MKRSMLIIAAVAALAGLSSTAAADEKTDAAVKELDQAFAKVKSYTAKTETMTNVEFGPGHTQKMEMIGTSEWLRKGDQALMRAETKCKTTKTEGGETTTTPSTITTVNDGQFLYVLSEEGEQKTVMKNQPMSLDMQQPKGFFAQYQSYYDIKQVEDAKVDGHDCFVFEMRMKPMDGVPPSGRQLVSFWKDHGILVKSEAFDANGKLTTSSITKDIKINPTIGADRFKFEIPEGAQVMDTTGGQQQPPPEEAKTNEEQPEKEEKKPEEKKKKGIKLPKWP